MDQLPEWLVEFGPSEFPAYARLRYLPDPAYEGQSENDVDVDDLDRPGDEPVLMNRLLTLKSFGWGLTVKCYWLVHPIRWIRGFTNTP